MAWTVGSFLLSLPPSLGDMCGGRAVPVALRPSLNDDLVEIQIDPSKSWEEVPRTLIAAVEIFELRPVAENDVVVSQGERATASEADLIALVLLVESSAEHGPQFARLTALFENADAEDDDCNTTYAMRRRARHDIEDYPGFEDYPFDLGRVRVGRG